MEITKHQTNQLPNAMGQSPSWEPSSRSDCQKFQLVLRNPNVHYRIHNSPPLVSFLSQINTFPTLSSYPLNIRFDISLYATLLFPVRVTWPLSPHSSIFHHWNSVWWGVQVIRFHIMQKMIITEICKYKMNAPTTTFIHPQCTQVLMAAIGLIAFFIHVWKWCFLCHF